jgi:endoglycosylceramidase
VAAVLRARFAVAVAALAMAGCLATAPPAQGAGSGPGPNQALVNLGHAGRFLTDPAGQVVVLHGLNMVSKVAPYEPAAVGFGIQAARSLAANGFDVVRLGVIYAGVEPEPGVFSASYIASIKRTVAILASQGVYSLLDFHQDQMSTGFGGEGFPAWSVDTSGLPITKFPFPTGYTSSTALNNAFDNFWADKPGPGGIGLQERYAAAWRFVAARFAGNPSVLGYDLFNEPWPGHTTEKQIATLYTKVIPAIRSVDREHLIFYEPSVLFDFGQPTTLPKFSDKLLGMSFHDYCLLNAATNVASCTKTEHMPVANALARSAATGDALIETEFGASGNLADIARVEGLADAHAISWIEWAYCGCDDPTGTVPASIEGLVTDQSEPATGSNVDAAKLAVLAEPYPRATSGTPLAYLFDHTTRTMTYEYSVTSPSKKHFGAGSCTAILVPEVQYPDGYAVEAHGARVTSPPGAGVLTLDQLRSPTVTVEIRPAQGGRTSLPRSGAIAACQ